MSDGSASVSSIPWLWVIETLASFKEVNTALLQELIELAPGFPDHLGKNTREMVSLRCLEDLFGPCSENVNAVSSARDSKLGFDLSESCEDVLQHILHETSVVKLRMAESERLQWDAHPFITHKRASMPKCALQLLKETIIEGTHPCAAYLKEISGLAFASATDRNHADDGQNSRACGLIRSDNDAQDNGAKGTVVNGNKLLEEDSHDTNLSPSKRDRAYLATENQEGNFRENHCGTNDCDDLHLNSKKPRLDSSCDIRPVKDSPIPLQQREVLKDSSEIIIEDSETFDGNSAKDQVGDLEVQSKALEDNHEHIFSKNRGQSDDEFHHNNSEIPCEQNRKHQDTSGDKPHQNSSVEEVENLGDHCAEPETSIGASSGAKRLKISATVSNGQCEFGFQLKAQNVASQENMDNCYEDEMLSDSDGYHIERIDVATKKNEFLLSQSQFGHDSLATIEWTDQNLCLKCNKGGELLVCNTSSCQLVVHDNCLGSSARFDNDGNFYCPFCSYSRAISEYLESKKKASVTRKELAAFLRLGFGDSPKELAKRSHGEEYNHSRPNGDKDDLVKDLHNESLGGREGNPVNHKDKRFKKTKGMNNRQQAEPSTSHAISNIQCREEEGHVTDDTVPGFTGKEKGRRIKVQECVSAVTKPYRNTISGKEIALTKQRQTEVGIQERVLQQEVVPEKPACGLNIDAGENSEDVKNKSTFSNYSIRFRRQDKQYTYPAIPQLRRKKLSWKVEEEEILKEGMRRFSNVDDKSIPWKKILEFGADVFQKGRMPMDLKDKWRNLCKGSQHRNGALSS